MITKNCDLDKIEDFMRDKDRHICHPIFSHDVYAFGNPDSIEKLSLQGNTVEDSIELIHLLKDYLLKKNITFKSGTKTRFDLRELFTPDEKEMNRRKEQSHKAMTIYCPVGVDILTLAEEVYQLIKDYKGGEGVTCPTSYNHYKGAIYYRRDIDENGQYINPN